MGCFAQGIFYVQDYIRPKLICLHLDENADLRKQPIQHWQDSDDDIATNPFPSIFPSIYQGTVYLIMASFAIKDDDFTNPLVCSFDIFFFGLIFSVQMQTVSCYSIDAYQQIANSQASLDDTISSLLSPMPLILQGNVIVRDEATYEIYDTPEMIEKYSKWRYFTGEIEQYAEGEIRVITLLSLSISLSQSMDLTLI